MLGMILGTCMVGTLEVRSEKRARYCVARTEGPGR